MKYSEFKKLIEQEGLNVNNDSYLLGVYDSETGDTLLTISKETILTLSTDYLEFSVLSDHDKKIFSGWAIKLASTPLDEREDEKRYRLKLPFAMESGGYLNTYNDRFFVGSKINVIDHKTIFTESEIAELKQKYNLDSFVMEEVKEDE